MSININKAAKILFKSRTQKKRLSKLPKDCNPKNKKEAYDIQAALMKEYKLNQKRNNIIGKKIGCTNIEAQKQINVHEPFYGNLISNYVSKSESTLKINEFFNPYIEPEFAFVIKNKFDISKAPFSKQDVFKNLSYVLPSIEIVDSRFKNWTKIGINSLIADNGVNAHWVYGKKIDNIKSLNFKNHQVSVFINNKIIEIGNSKNVMNNPINSLTWLINTLSNKKLTISKGSYITTGTCTKAIPVKKGDKIKADFGKLGMIKLNFV